MSHNSMSILKIFLTGQPSVGKTTIIKHVLQHFHHNNHNKHTVNVKGFYTEECRNENGERGGFDIVYYGSSSNNGNGCSSSNNNSRSSSVVRRAALSRHASSFKKSDPRVGKYLVNVPNVEKYCVGSISSCSTNIDGSSYSNHELIIVDEIGKMEMLCPSFLPAIDELMSTDTYADSSNCHSSKRRTILGTIPTPRYGRIIQAVEDIRARNDVIVIHVTKFNRDELKDVLVETLEQCYSDDTLPTTLTTKDKLGRFLYTRPIGASSLKGHNNSANNSDDRTSGVESKSASNETTTSSYIDSDRSACSSKPCGPLLADITAPKILILGETASPLPSNTDYSYCERSMWSLLGRIFRNNEEESLKPIKDWKKASQKDLQSFVELKDLVISKGICIWDVFADVHGGTSIKNKKRKTNNNHEKYPNNIKSFLEENPSINQICFIGKKAYTSFVETNNSKTVSNVELITLPSSSPANSRLSVDEKAKIWKEMFAKHITI